MNKQFDQNLPLSEALEKSLNEDIDSVTDFIILDALCDPANKDVPYQKMHDQVAAEIGFKETRQRVNKGLKLILQDLTGHLPKVELQQIQNEIDGIAEKIGGLFNQKIAESEVGERLDALPDSLQGLFGFSDASYEHFYQVGGRYFSSGRYGEASDVYFALVTLNPYKYNVWTALGLSEMKAHQWDRALQAFVMATLNEPSAVEPHLYSAECYIEKHDKAALHDTLDLALQTLEKHPVANQLDMQDYIRQLRRK